MDKTIAIDNRYLIAERIKDGGFGIIHKGFDLKFDKNVVAIKEIHHFYSKDQKFIDMFQDEAVTTAKLNHPNIVNVYDLRVTADKRFYIIMEFIEGIDIRTLIQRCQYKGSCIPTKLGVYIIGEVCKALDHAHNKKDPVSGESLNIIHRDISPSNIMVTVDGIVKVIDFGIAKARYRKSQETEYGIMKGKVNYMSPEQIHGSHLDHRSDLFSLGIVLFETITGQKLFWDDSDLGLLNKVAEAKIDPEIFEKHQIAPELRKIILKAVQKKPEDRYQSAREMYQDIHSYIQKATTIDLGFLLSEFIQEHYAEEQQRRAAVKKDKIKIDEGTEIIKTHSISSDLARKELQTAEKTPPPLPPADEETILIKPKKIKPPYKEGEKQPYTRPAKFEKARQTFSRLWIKRKDYTRELNLAAIALASALVLFLLLAIAIPFTSVGESIHYSLFRLSWEIRTVPPGAKVIIDGEALPGKTPLIFKKKRGSYNIQLQRAGFGTLSTMLNISPNLNKISEYVFEVVMSFDSEPQDATVLLNGKENLLPTPCEIHWKIIEPLQISMTHRDFDPIDGFIFQGINRDPEIVDSTRWKYNGVPGSQAKLEIKGNFHGNYADAPAALKNIKTIHLKKAFDDGKLKQDDILIKAAVGKDFPLWNQLSWYQRKDLPDTFYFLEMKNEEEAHRILYIGPIDPKLAQNPDQVIQQYKLNDLKVDLKYLVLEKFNLIEQQPVMTIFSVSPIEAISN